MNKELLQERKKMIYDFICDELYVPMKAKEMAIVLNVPKSQRGELLEVLDALTAPGGFRSGRWIWCISTPTTILTQENLLLPKLTSSPSQGWTPGA